MTTKIIVNQPVLNEQLRFVILPHSLLANEIINGNVKLNRHAWVLDLYEV